MKTTIRISVLAFLSVLLMVNASIADKPKKIADILGITYGFEYSNFKAWPRNPYTGDPLTLTGVPDLRQKDDFCYQANFYNLTLNTYGSLLGTYLLAKTKSRVIIGDYSEFGLGMGFARAMDIDENLVKEHGNTVGFSANMGTGLMAGYKINDDILASVRYQWIIEQYFSPYENSKLNAVHRKKFTVSCTWQGFALAVNVASPWALKQDKTQHIVWQNKGMGVELKYRLGEKSVIGFDYNHTKIRFKDLDNDPIPYWDSSFSSFGLFLGMVI
jgi:hypothetical protein